MAEEKTSPVYSFGTANRNNSSSELATKYTPGPIYSVTDKYKYKAVNINILIV